MSTQRRRVLEDTKIPDGVYIEGLDGKVYTVNSWFGSYTANSVIVASGDVKFRIALTQSSSTKQIDSASKSYDYYMTAISGETAAKVDYDGAGNTAKMLLAQSNAYYAAGYCNSFIFPDGKTKGFLPSLGQLWLAYQNKAAVDAALRKCGGTVMGIDSDFPYLWTSTYYIGGSSYGYFF